MLAMHAADMQNRPLESLLNKSDVISRFADADFV
jgi:hypothetical protein